MILDVLRALGRRWYVVLVGLLLTAGMVYGAGQASPPEYHARALVLLLPSPSAVGPGGNPFLGLSGLEQPAGIVVAYFSSAPARAEVEELSPTAEYEIALEASTRGPVIAVDVTSSSSAETMATLDHLVDGIPQQLDRLQAQVAVAPPAAIGSMPLAVDQQAQEDRSGTVRLMIAALVVGLVITGLAGYGLDSLAQRRRLGKPRHRRRAAGQRRIPAAEDDTSRDEYPADAVSADADSDREASVSEAYAMQPDVGSRRGRARSKQSREPDGPSAQPADTESAEPASPEGASPATPSDAESETMRADQRDPEPAGIENPDAESPGAIASEMTSPPEAVGDSDDADPVPSEPARVGPQT